MDGGVVHQTLMLETSVCNHNLPLTSTVLQLPCADAAGRKNFLHVGIEFVVLSNRPISASMSGDIYTSLCVRVRAWFFFPPIL